MTHCILGDYTPWGTQDGDVSVRRCYKAPIVMFGLWLGDLERNLRKKKIYFRLKAVTYGNNSIIEYFNNS